MEKESGKNCGIIVDKILEQITCGKLKKGDKLPTERKLVEDLNVSRASVREAIKSLESMGIVNSIQGSGSYITDVPEKTINKPLCALFALSNGTLDNVLQLRIIIESNVCRDIVTNARDDEIEALCSLADYDYISLPTSEQAILDARFHHALVQMSHNTLIKYLYNTLSSLMDMYREQVLRQTFIMNENALTRDGHFAICRALRARDPEAAENAITEHLDLNDIYRQSLLPRE
jgi:GntR family transcriptional repressor for pyruvate dehydrogenase complex